MPNNYSTQSKIRGSNILNLLEGLGIALFLSFLTWQIPFVRKLKIALCLIYIILFLILELKGNKDYTLLTSLFAYIHWKRNSKVYHLGNVSEVEEQKILDLSEAYSFTKKGVKNLAKEIKERFFLIIKKDNK